jgi:DNA-binding MarR family transcriptional regulator
LSQSSLSEFADKMNEIMPVIMKEFSRRHMSEYKGKITLPQFLILGFLHVNDESKMSDLAHFMNVTTAAMTGIVERLVRDGYLVRVYDDKDRRIIKVKLTLEGNGLVKEINQHKRQMLIKIFSDISVADRRQYLRILTQIKDILTLGQSR